VELSHGTAVTAVTVGEINIFQDQQWQQWLFAMSQLLGVPDIDYVASNFPGWRP
jgi:hypothetical protein